MRLQADFWSFLSLALSALTISPASALNCDKTFTYYEEYGQNSFNVSCSGITKGYEHILENITINNEISLTISDSQLVNVTPVIFKNVRNIKVLNIFNSTFEYDPALAIFEKLEKLDALVVTDTPFEIENVTFKGLSTLKKLQLRNNSIRLVESESLENLVNLEKLELTENHVKSLEDLPLCELKKLKYLNLRSNLLSNLKASRFFCAKKPLNIEVNNHKPSTSYYNIAPVTYDLLELDLSYNQIVDLGYSLDSLSKLRVLNLGYNKLVSIKNINLKWLLKLQKLNATHNELVTVQSAALANKTQLVSVDLSYNRLKNLEVTNLPQLQFLDASFNQLSLISLKNLTKLKKLNLGHNDLVSLSSSLNEVPNLLFLDLAANRMEALSVGWFQNLTSLRYMCLSNNLLNQLPEKVFSGLTNLRVLDLSSNKLDKFNLSTFHDLANLEVLNLSSNSIESLSYITVEPLKNLRSLDLGDNKLMYIEYELILSKLPGLSNINIKSNQLTCEDLGSIINFLKRKHIVYTSSEHIENLSQNVAGIPCRTAINNMLVSGGEFRSRGGHSALFNFGIFLIVAFAAVLTGIVSFRFYVYLKRRRYRADEFELVVE